MKRKSSVFFLSHLKRYVWSGYSGISSFLPQTTDPSVTPLFHTAALWLPVCDKSRQSQLEDIHHPTQLSQGSSEEMNFFQVYYRTSCLYCMETRSVCLFLFFCCFRMWGVLNCLGVGGLFSMSSFLLKTKLFGLCSSIVWPFPLPLHKLRNLPPHMCPTFSLVSGRWLPPPPLQVSFLPTPLQPSRESASLPSPQGHSHA